jgi:photosystem II stability/assembly factor-like uncharacterized protein
MKKILIPLVLFLTITIFAQEGWYYQSPQYIRDIHFIEWNKAVAVGNGVWISNDVGKSWEGYYPGYSEDYTTGYSQKMLYAVHFPNTVYGYAVGPRGIFVKSANGGTIWNQINISLPYTFYDFFDVKFINSETGFIVGQAFQSGSYKGFILKTTDYGSTWTLIRESSVYFSVIEITESNIIWVGGGSSYLIKSTDMGATWTDVSSGILGVPSDIKFVDDNRGLMLTGNMGYLYKTTNGGSSWQTIETGISGNGRYLSYFSNGVVFATCEGKLYKSINHGDTWSLENESVDLSSKAVFADQNRGLICGSRDWAETDYAVTIDGGENLKKYDWSISHIYFRSNNSEGWAANYLHLFKTTNGRKWEAFDLVHSGEEKLNNIRKFQFLTSNKGFAIGYLKLTPTMAAPRFLITDNGGASWNSHDFVDANPFDFYFVDGTYGWVVGPMGKIYKTLDGAATWGPQNSSTSEFLYGVYFDDENLGWAVGSSNTIIKTMNGGLLWDTRTPGTASDKYNAVMSYGANVCFVAGNNTVIKSADGGDTWTDVTPPTYKEDNKDIIERHKIFMKSTSEVYLFFSGGYYRTNDGGGTWKRLGDFVDLHPQNSSVMWAANNGIFYTSNGGVVDVEDEVPATEIVSDYKLYQNYPNPFNPVTKIKFTIPSNVKSETVNMTLKVFNILGKEVATLINEEKNPGNYEVEWNASGLASGIYFYQLKTAGFIENRKMMLIK